MESFPFVDPDCQIYCGKSLPYMYYTGTEFCVQDANELGGWIYHDLTTGYYDIDLTMVVEGTALS